MLLPNDKGLYQCEECDYAGRDIFKYLEHCGIQYSWMLPLGEDCTFNFFGFLRELHNVLLFSNGIKEAMELIQSTTLLMVNSSEDTLKEFLDEVTIQSNVEDLISKLEEELDKKE